MFQYLVQLMVLLGKFKGCGLVGGGVSLEADFGSLTFIHSYFTLSFLVAVWDASSRLFWPLCLPLVAITPFLNRLWTQEPLISSFSFTFTWNQITSPSCINPHPFSFLGQKACPRLLGRLLRKNTMQNARILENGNVFKSPLQYFLGCLEGVYFIS